METRLLAYPARFYSLSHSFLALNFLLVFQLMYPFSLRDCDISGHGVSVTTLGISHCQGNSISSFFSVCM